MENLVVGISNQQSIIIHQPSFQACEEARDRRNGESSLPPAANT